MAEIRLPLAVWLNTGEAAVLEEERSVHQNLIKEAAAEGALMLRQHSVQVIWHRPRLSL